jgi:tRNA (guanine-N7-)-methyltransferase
MDTLESHPHFKNRAGDHMYSERPEYRPLTKFENRGQKLGHGVWDIIFTKTKGG